MASGYGKMKGYVTYPKILGEYGVIAVIGVRKYKGKIYVKWINTDGYDPIIRRSEVRYNPIDRPYIYTQDFGKQFLDEFDWFDARLERMFEWHGL